MAANRHPAGEVARLIVSRTTVFELVLVAVVLGLGVKLLASGLPPLIRATPAQTSLAALTMIGAALAYVAIRAVRPLDRRRSIEAFFVYDREANTVLDIPRYDYGFYLSEYLRAAFAENSALEAAWNRDPLSAVFAQKEDSDTLNEAGSAAKQLVTEATEYYVLSTLSTHLTDYFNRPGFDSAAVVTLEREHVPDVLLKNRFLELFSRPMEDRPAFIEDKPQGVLSDRRYVIASSARGALFEHFDLVLPPGSKVRRASSTEVCIQTKRLTIQIGVRFDGFGTVLPDAFEEIYMSGAHAKTYAFQVLIDLTVSFPFLALFRPAGWQYYEWVDSFLHTLDDSCAKDEFFARIGWEGALTTIELLQRSTKHFQAPSRGQP